MFVRKLAVGFLACVLLVLAGCSTVDPSVYRSDQPTLDVQRYFSGTIEGHGLFMDRGGEVKRRFVVTIKASWAGDTGTLDEDFVWSDGERERRVWTLRRDRDAALTAGTRWTGTADGVVGTATGTASGNALNWRYAFDLKTGDGKQFRVDFDDWMFLIDDRVLLNRAVMSYYGIRVGELFISFRKLP